MSPREYAYVSYITTTPDELWSAITGKEFWLQFSGPAETDWRTGSPIKYFLPDGTLYAEGFILESSLPRVLVHTWPNPESEQTAEPIQRLTWRIEQSGPDTVKLTMLHENLRELDYQGSEKAGQQFWATNLRFFVRSSPRYAGA